MEEVGINTKPALRVSFSAGLTKKHPVSSMGIDVSELSLQCLFQMVSNCTDQTVKQFVDDIKNMMEKKEEIVEIRISYEEKPSAVGSMNETKTATCTCEMSNTTGVKDETNKTQHGKSHKATNTHGSTEGKG